ESQRAAVEWRLIEKLGGLAVWWNHRTALAEIATCRIGEIEGNRGGLIARVCYSQACIHRTVDFSIDSSALNERRSRHTGFAHDHASVSIAENGQARWGRISRGSQNPRIADFQRTCCSGRSAAEATEICDREILFADAAGELDLNIR